MNKLKAEQVAEKIQQMIDLAVFHTRTESNFEIVVRLKAELVTLLTNE